MNSNDNQKENNVPSKKISIHEWEFLTEEKYVAVVRNTEQQREALKQQIVNQLSEYSHGDLSIEVEGGSSESEVSVRISTNDPVLVAMLEELEGAESE